MRRILLIVLVALLPLQWSGAAAAVRCLHGGTGHGHGAHGLAEPGHPDVAHADHRHADHGHSDHGHSDHGHSDHGHAGHGHAGHGPATAGHGADHDRDEVPSPGVLAGLADCGHADCGGCCHGGCTLPSACRAMPAPSAFGAAPATRVDASPVSPALDGPFRPPRPQSA